VCNTRYLSGPPSGFSLRVIGRGMQTNSVRISSADNRTFAYLSAEIDELKVRGQIGVGERPGGFQVEVFCIFQAGIS
jgi:hypothetical protein